MRVLAVDVGARRVGLAISDPTGTLARPLKTLQVSGADGAVAAVAAEIESLAREDDGLAGVVVGVPTRLDGSPGDQTTRVVAFIGALGRATVLPIAQIGERLTSREAESRLALREKDWRVRKQRLDAAAAAVILQEYLDGRQ